MRFVFVAALCAASLYSQEPTLDQILEKNLNAVGGPAIREVQTVKMTATMLIAGNVEVPMTTLIRRPNLIRTEVTYQGQPVVTAFDGTTAWMLAPGSKEPQTMDDKSAASLASADVDSSLGALALLRTAGHTFELLGKEPVNGKPAYKIRVTRKNGTVTLYLLDTDSGLPVKIVSTLPQMGQTIEVESYPTAYGKEGPVLMAHSIDNRVQGRSMMQVTVKKIEFNVNMDDSLFQMPVAPKQPEKGEEKESERSMNR